MRSSLSSKLALSFLQEIVGSGCPRGGWHSSTAGSPTATITSTGFCLKSSRKTRTHTESSRTFSRVEINDDKSQYLFLLLAPLRGVVFILSMRRFNFRWLTDVILTALRSGNFNPQMWYTVRWCLYFLNVRDQGNYFFYLFHSSFTFALSVVNPFFVSCMAIKHKIINTFVRGKKFIQCYCSHLVTEFSRLKPLEQQIIMYLLPHVENKTSVPFKGSILKVCLLALFITYFKRSISTLVQNTFIVMSH